jgi:hypothetical protein
MAKKTKKKKVKKKRVLKDNTYAIHGSFADVLKVAITPKKK